MIRLNFLIVLILLSTNPAVAQGRKPKVDDRLAPLPQAAPSPPDNPMTPEKVSLGKQLFFDPRLSGDNTMSCASCQATIAAREGRGLEGFSQGGRGTARYMFKYPDLFCSAAPMGGGHQHEKRVSENNGDEGEYRFEPTNNTYDLARKYAADSKELLRILVVVGDRDMNYEANLEWMEHLRSLKIPFEQIVVKGVGHFAQSIYKQTGLKVMNFHARNFKNAEINGGK